MKNAPVQAAPKKFGTILRINSVHGFVLIQKDTSALLPEWEGVDSAPVLCSSDPHHPNALLRISPESRRNLVIADILEGKPTLGDSVFIWDGSKNMPDTRAPGEAPPAGQPAVEVGQDG